MSRPRQSIIWTISEDDFTYLVKNSNSISEIIRKLKLSTNGSSNHNSVKKRIQELNLDISHIRLGLDNNKNKKIIRKKKPLTDVMIENSSYSRQSLKIRLLNDGLLKNSCDICGQLPYWQEKKLVMILDHINGIHDDHRLENLRLLCPNCNSQQPTFCGKNIQNKRKIQLCKDCGIKISKNANKCKTCFNLSQPPQPTKIQWPDNQILQSMVDKSNYSAVARKLGVSDNAIRNRLRVARSGNAPLSTL